jgi:hypothetical protein
MCFIIENISLVIIKTFKMCCITENTPFVRIHAYEKVLYDVQYESRMHYDDFPFEYDIKLSFRSAGRALTMRCIPWIRSAMNLGDPALGIKIVVQIGDISC